MTAVTIFLVFWWLARPRPSWFGSDVAAEIAVSLRRVSAQVRSGAHDWRPQVHALLPSGIDAAIEEAWLAGTSLRDSLKALEHSLACAGKWARDSTSICRLFWSRGAMMAAVAVVIRLWLGVSGYRDAALREQIVCGVLAGVMFAICMCGLRLGIGHAWPLGPDGVGDDVSIWLNAHIRGVSTADTSWATVITPLSDREWTYGVSLLAEIRLLLEDWSSERIDAAKQRLGTITDALPAVELLGLGVPLMLLIHSALIGGGKFVI